MNFTNIKKNVTRKKCAFPLCENIFEGSQFQFYCTDPRCVEVRLELAKRLREERQKQEQLEDPNISIPKNTHKNGDVLVLTCEADSPHGKCNRTFTVLYDTRRTTYPRFCDRHANEYQRTRFKEGQLCHS